MLPMPPGIGVAALGGDLTAGRVLRTGQWIERGGARLEPLAADPRGAVEAHVRREGIDVRRDEGGGRDGLRGSRTDEPGISPG